jgi:zinc transporter ZupT
VVIMVGFGILALAALERAIHGMERPQEAHDHGTLGQRAHLMPLGIASDGLHNAIDGALIATAFLTNPTLGVFAGLAIALHELPRELGTFALCVSGGMSPRRAILVNAATGVLALLGAVAALLIGVDAQRFGRLLVPFAAGNFLYLAAAILVAQRTPRHVHAAPGADSNHPTPSHGAHPHPLAPEQQRDSAAVRWALVGVGVALTALMAGVHS